MMTPCALARHTPHAYCSLLNGWAMGGVCGCVRCGVLSISKRVLLGVAFPVSMSSTLALQAVSRLVDERGCEKSGRYDGTFLGENLPTVIVVRSRACSEGYGVLLPASSYKSYLWFISIFFGRRARPTIRTQAPARDKQKYPSETARVTEQVNRDPLSTYSVPYLLLVVKTWRFNVAWVVISRFDIERQALLYALLVLLERSALPSS